MKQLLLSMVMSCMGLMTVQNAVADDNPRRLWGSINSNSDASHLPAYNNRILLTWRLLPSDDATVSFDLYRSADGGAEVKVNAEPIVGKTNYQDTSADCSKTNSYRLTKSGSNATIGSYTMPAAQASAGLPYVQINLEGTSSVCSKEGIWYEANDAGTGDLDGDGMPEIVIKRLLTRFDTDGVTVIEGTAATESPHDVRHTVLYEAYKLDGTFLWRICSGPNIMLGNSSSFAIADFDGDGKCEMAIKTGEGTVFGDGAEIGDTDGDGVTDYREDGKHYIGLGPEFFSVVDGVTGRELARANYITRGASEDWGDNYFKRASSLRVAVANVSGGNPSVLICRGVYARSVLEAWDYSAGSLTRRWHFDSSATGKGKDGKANSLYAAQGFHSLSVGDVDGDGRDEIVYGSMTVDDDGKGLYSSEYGHGDALHLGKFDPSREGLQIFSCQEFGKTAVVLRDALDGSTIWSKETPSDNDTGRGLIADIDPTSPGCEAWWYDTTINGTGTAHSIDGTDLGWKPTSCNMAIWFGPGLNRQLFNETSVHQQYDETRAGTDSDPYTKGRRIFTLDKYDVSKINGTKGNPAWYGDMLGDWREEIIMPDATRTHDIKVFSTWYPTDYLIPYLMSDHVYEMSAMNENVGYNMPTQTGFYIGSDKTQYVDVINIDVEISDVKYATFGNYTNAPLAVPEGVTAYGVSSFNDNNVVFTEYNVIPAGAGVILHSNAAGTFNFRPTDEACSYDGVNYLVAVTEDQTVPTTADGNINYFFCNKSQGLGFYQSDGTGTITKGKAYLSIPNTADTRSWDFTSWSNATISALEAERTGSGANWTQGAVNGDRYRYKNVQKLNDATLTANGSTIAETDGLLFTADTGNLQIDNRSTGQLYIGNSSVVITIPNLKANHQVTIKTKSSSGSNGSSIVCTDGTNVTRTGNTEATGNLDNIFEVHVSGTYSFKLSDTKQPLNMFSITIEPLGEVITNAAPFYIIENGTPTGIEPIHNLQFIIHNDTPMYNLSGQKVSSSYKGIVIINGRKVKR